jgi:hypothetical protein
MNLYNIAKSWYEFQKADQETRILMDKRLAVCETCPHKEQLSSIGKLLVTSINEKGSIYRCGICKCPLAAKTAHPANTCPDTPQRWGMSGY